MLFTRSLAHLACLSLSALLLSCSPSGERKVVLKFGHLANESHIWHQSALHFADQVAELSQGAMEVQVFPSEQLGKELEMIRSIQAGIIDIAVSGESMQNWTPYAAFCGMPYLVDDPGGLKALIESPAGQTIASEIEGKVGLRPIGYFVRGARHLTSNRPIRHPSELRNLILRVPSVPISIAAWNALGAKTTPMAFSEVFTALQANTIEAQENPLDLIESGGFHEVQRYVNLTNHVVGWVYVLIGTDRFAKLSPEQQEIVLEAGRRMQAFHEELFADSEADLRMRLEKRGMEFVHPDIEAFKAIADRAVEAELPPAILPLYREIKGQ